MKIAVLSREKRNYSTSRLVEEAKKAGLHPRVLDTLKFSMFIERGKPSLTYRNRKLGRVDAVIPRIGASITGFGTAVVRHFEQMGMFCLNSSTSISVSRDKLRSIQILSRHRIDIPKTAFVRERGALMPALAEVGGAPVVIKLLEGTQGIGVILAESDRIAEAIVETLQSAKQQVLIQKFVKESKGKDIRAFVIGDRVVAAMRRSAAHQDEFRSNVHRGGTVEAVELDEEYQRTAVHAAQIMGLRVAGVDILESNEGPKIMEVNSSPGLEGIEKASGMNIAGMIIDYVKEQALFPEVDIRQRLTLNAGYGVVEIPVGKKSELARRTISESGLRDRDIVVLSILRDTLTIPNPRPSREMLPGDMLLCYGKLMTMKSLIPVKKPRKRKKDASS